MNKKLPGLLSLIPVLLLVQGCAPSSYAVDAPEASGVVFVPTSAEADSTLTFTDARIDAYTPFSTGVLPMSLTHDGVALEPVDYLAQYTVAELAARGIPVAASDAGDAEVRINKISMRNYRSTGFSPFTTTTMLSADVVGPSDTHRVGAFLMRGKVPVWSFDEIIEPTLNQPLELLVQELAAKINMHLYSQTATDADVQALVDKVNANRDDGLAYLSVYQLGFSNNATAIPALVDMSNAEEQYVRLAAISSLGAIKAADQVDHLIGIFTNDAYQWQDRAMAVKALCDLAVMGSEQADNFVRTEVELGIAGETATGATWIKEILGLYLRN